MQEHLYVWAFIANRVIPSKRPTRLPDPQCRFLAQSTCTFLRLPPFSLRD